MLFLFTEMKNNQTNQIEMISEELHEMRYLLIEEDIPIIALLLMFLSVCWFYLFSCLILIYL
jgi:hypothetical protein